MQQRVMRAAVAAALALAGCRDRGPVAVIRGPGAAVEVSLEVAATPAEQSPTTRRPSHLASGTGRRQSRSRRRRAGGAGEPRRLITRAVPAAWRIEPGSDATKGRGPPHEKKCSGQSTEWRGTSLRMQ